MKNTTPIYQSKRQYIERNNIKYTTSEICPCCGEYTPDGQVCNKCLQKNDLYIGK